MKYYSYLLILSMTLLASCAMGDWLDDDSSSTPKRKGWRYGGVFAENDARYGFRDLAVVGNSILITSSSGTIYVRKQNDSAWNKMVAPSGDSVTCLIASDSAFYIGTRTKGEVWRYTPSSDAWFQVPIAETKTATNYIVGLALYQNSLVVNAVKNGESNDSIYFVDLKSFSVTAQSQNWCQGQSCGMIDGQEMLGDLYVTTYSAG